MQAWKEAGKMMVMGSGWSLKEERPRRKNEMIGQGAAAPPRSSSRKPEGKLWLHEGKAEEAVGKHVLLPTGGPMRVCSKGNTTTKEACANKGG